MENNWKKKLMSMFLVFALCPSMIPTSAMAEEAAGGNAAAGQEEQTTGDPAGAEASSERLSLNAPESITYTEDLTITAEVVTAGAVTYKWFEDGTELTDQTGKTLTLKDTPRTSPYTTNPEPAEYGNVGDHIFRCEATIDGDVISKEVTVTVKPADLPFEQLNFVGFLYEGRNNTIDFRRDVDYTVEGAQFKNADAGDRKTVIIKFRMLNPNYSFAGGQREIEIVRSQQNAGSATQEIVKAAVADQSVDLEVMNGHAKTYNVDLAELIPELTAPKQYGDITYGQPVVQLYTGYYAAGGAKVENGVLSLPIKQVDTKAEGEIGTVKVVVSTTNYKDMTLTVNVKATNKLIPTGAPTLSKSSLTYSETLGNMKLSGSMKYENAAVEGTFAWDTPDAKPAATAAYAAKWTFIPKDGTMYQTVNGTTEIPVNKATPSGAPVYTQITTAGKTVTAAALAVNPSWPAGTVKWVDADGNTLDDSTEAKANTAYQWLFTPTDTANYNEATGAIVLYPVSSGGGSTGGSSTTKDDTTGGGTQTITVPVSSNHGDMKMEATVKGTTATVSVDSNQIDQIIADSAKTVTVDLSGLEGVDTVTLPVEIV